MSTNLDYKVNRNIPPKPTTPPKILTPPINIKPIHKSVVTQERILEHQHQVSESILRWSAMVSMLIPLMGIFIAPLAIWYSRSLKSTTEKTEFYEQVNTLSLTLYCTVLAVSGSLFLLFKSFEAIFVPFLFP